MSSTSTPRKSVGPASSGRITPTISTRTPTSRSSAAASSNRAEQDSSTIGTTTVHRSRGSIHNSNGTPLSARASVKKPGTPSSSATSLANLDTSQAAMMEELKDRLERAEMAAEDMRRSNDVLQAKLDDASKEAAKQEEKMHEDEERIEELENQKREVLKQKRELETIFEAERVQEMKAKEAAREREEEMQAVIGRLKESLVTKENANKEGGEFSLSRNDSFPTASSSPTLDANHFAPPPLQRSNSFRNNSKLLLQKDKLIEELRLELAELQIKLMELENKGGGRVQDLEKSIVEARMTNARLMEENESFQSLLMERTLNGEFSKQNGDGDRSRKESMGGAGGASLADELASISESEPLDSPERDGDRVRRLEVEVERQKAENKALTLYINKIIERILKHQGGFETILSNNEEDAATPTTPGVRRPSAPTVMNRDKDLPPSPPRDEQPQDQPSFLQRAKSLAYGRGGRPRPQSTFIGSASPQVGMMQPPAQPSLVENPATAPSIPLGRSQSQKRHSMAIPRRANPSSEFNLGAAAVVGNMTRGGGDSEPGSVVGSPRPGSSAYFGLMNRLPSGQRTAQIPPMSTPTPEGSESRPRTGESLDDSDKESNIDARQAALDALNGGGEDKVSGLDTPSPPRSQAGSSIKDGQDALSKLGREQSVLQGNKMRPLRLVTEEQKKGNVAGNRASWMPSAVGNLGAWFNANTGPNPNAPPGQTQVSQMNPANPATTPGDPAPTTASASGSGN